MALFFDGSSSYGYVQATGGLDVMLFGTVAAILRRAADGVIHSIFQLATAADADQMGFHIRDTNIPSWRQNAGTGRTPPTMTVTAADGWVFLAVGKATGTVLPRFHKYVYSTGVWTHENAGSTVANSTAPGSGGSAYLARNAAASSNEFHGDIQAIGVFGGLVADADIEQLPHSLDAWFRQNTRAVWLFIAESPTARMIDLSTGGANYVSGAAQAVTTTMPPFTYGAPVSVVTRTAPVVAGQPAILRGRGVPGMTPDRPFAGRGW